MNKHAHRVTTRNLSALSGLKIKQRESMRLSARYANPNTLKNITEIIRPITLLRLNYVINKHTSSTSISRIINLVSTAKLFTDISL